MTTAIAAAPALADQPPPPQPAPPSSKFLDYVNRPAPRQPTRLILYATEGWGKTSFAAMAPEPTFLLTRGENGRRLPSFRSILVLASALGCSVDDRSCHGIKIDDRRTHPRKATQIPGRSSPAGPVAKALVAADSPSMVAGSQILNKWGKIVVVAAAIHG